ncbi:MAG: polymerase sigma-70 factor, subfamily [Frankiaceae bacterium]|nr:polymerase sigma-70 factor, subfamily [Frankiaceae bacterium]
MAALCVRAEPPFGGLWTLQREVLRVWSTPRRGFRLAGAGREGKRTQGERIQRERIQGLPHGSAAAEAASDSSRRHATPSAPSPRRTAPDAARSHRTLADVPEVPSPTAPSGPLTVLPPHKHDDGHDEPGGAPDAGVAALVARAQAGDADAFGQLYDQYVDLVYRYIYYRVGGIALAEDLTSETFLRALRRIDSFRWQGKDFAAWLVTIGRNLITDHYKSGRYRLEVTTEDILETGRTQVADSPEDQVLDALTNETLLEAVRQLNAEQQECIVLRFLQGLSVSETALIMGKNDGAIKALQYRAVRALARLLPEEKLR